MSAIQHTKSSLVSSPLAHLSGKTVNDDRTSSLHSETGSRGSSSTSRGGGGAGSSRVDQAKIDRVRDMFPHLSTRSIRWELERNGASVERAVQRALREGGLPEVSLIDLLLSSLLDET